MLNRQEILDEINKTKEHLTNLEQILEECGYERWKPEPNEEYYYVNQVSEMAKDKNDEDNVDVRRYKAYNCFKTREQAEAEAEKILVRRTLEDIAKRLNKGEKTDWLDNKQPKYYIELYCNKIITNFYYCHKTQGTVYCLDGNFKDIAIQEIGEERLRDYLRGE